MGFFLEGLPKGLPLFGAPVALQLPVAKCRELNVRDVQNERTRTVLKIDGMADAMRLQSLAEQLDNLPDLSPLVPQRVRIFVSRMRSLCNGVREARSCTEFSQCANARCNRFFFAGVEVPHVSMPAELCDASIHRYWQSCGGGIPLYKDSIQRFCTSACSIEWHWQVNRCVPAGISFDMEGGITKTGIGRIQKAYDSALSRNGEFGRILKQTKKLKRRCKAVRTDVMDAELSSRIDMLNTDLGVLYWSTLMSKCPENIYDRSLPGDRPAWRGDSIHIYLVRTVSLIYAEITEQYPSSRNLITDTLSVPRFFSILKSHSAALL